ncbi:MULTISPECIES: PilC/PilY family type IV pilus protein [unclassified Variovorax]|jgi:type IV pilus assembly protein PilY1|uniref:pilus assembly protein n=1 Tax=unclassified Variovorax TaxID=663243 RepID=UPI000F7F1997|nr:MULTISPECIES: PilC/PilY family type IV pilus protein [unclassified Variovorax]RSZ35038.1 pilus assembly protein PilY [Variovorax sp. 553]RSZ35944.1 pilus assembly protein PilY [Variovorax sp. 679]
MNIEKFSRNAAVCGLMLAQTVGQAAQYSLAQAPRSTAAREPAPNVIVSADNTDRMAVGDDIGALKAALRGGFSEANIPNDRVRLAWQALEQGASDRNCAAFLSSRFPCLIGGRVNANLMRSLDSTHRANFMTWLDILQLSGRGAADQMMIRAGDYMKTTGRYSPYSDDPGVEEATQSGCRRSFHILLTDGFGMIRRSPGFGNEDGTRRVLPDSVIYEPRAPYRDNFGDALNGTLADLAFHYWATDLQPGMPNKLRTLVAEAGDVTVGATTVPEYWNPKNNPATWQHLTTYTIGLNTVSWEGRPYISATAVQPAYSGDYSGLVDGSISWPYHNRIDLWHTALSSRGTFIPASNAQALRDAIKSILDRILTDTSPRQTSISASTSRLSTGTIVYQSGYDPSNWSGVLTATKFDTNGKLASKPEWSAGDLLDARMAKAGAHVSDRKVLSFSGTTVATTTSTATVGSGVPFRWDRLSDAQKAALKGSTATDAKSTAFGRAVLDFLRGDRSNEDTGLGLRKRSHVLGDIVGSSVWYTGQPRSGFTSDAYATFASTARTPMVYAGANDGMLHAFNAGTGREEFAYVPEGLYGTAAAPNLKRLSEGAYSHRYYVDGSAFVADIYMGAAATAKTTNAEKAAGWKSFLVGTLGAGGKGYFVLDVTKPENIYESRAASVALIDTTALSDRDLGHQFQQPALDSFSRRAVQVAPLNNGRKAVILGNGYNSTSEKAVLWIQYLDDDKSVLKIPAPATQDAGTGNGLSAPRVVDRDGDGKVDYAYAGDLRGNLWRFDLSDTDSRKWKATMGSGATPSSLDNVPLFAAGATQPITAAPVVVGHPRGGYMVVFGTGRLFASGDDGTTAGQYLYGVRDPANGDAGTAALTDLVAQTIGVATVEEDGGEFRTVSASDVSYSGSDAKRGWSLQLPTAGERIVYPGDALSSSAGLFSTTIPGTGSNSADCTAGTGDDGWSMVIDFFSGSAPDGIAYNASATAGSYLGFRNRSGKDDIAFEPQDRAKGKDVICNAAGDCNTPKRPDVVRRFGWRNLMSSSN